MRKYKKLKRRIREIERRLADLEAARYMAEEMYCTGRDESKSVGGAARLNDGTLTGGDSDRYISAGDASQIEASFDWDRYTLKRGTGTPPNVIYREMGLFSE
jgi:hypothetical protein